MKSVHKLKFLGTIIMVTARVTGNVDDDFEVEIEKITTEKGDDIGELVACSYVRSSGNLKSMDDAIERALRDKLISELP